MSTVPGGPLARESCALMVIDLQEKLLPHIHEADRVLERVVRMIDGARHLGLPVLVTEQYPRGLGPTVEPVRAAAAAVEAPVLEKTTFGCFATPTIAEAVRALDARAMLLVGIEAHVCVAQTALQGLGRGLQVHVVSDAVGSRAQENVVIGLSRLYQAGAVITSSEMALFELLHDASSAAFRDVARLVR
jgi:nicotinamidase-related amidase